MHESNVERRICSKCHEEKGATDFNFRSRATGVRHSYCKDCGKQLTRDQYAGNKRQYLDRNVRSYLKRRELVKGIKSCQCADCGIQYPYYVMDFDHREGEIKQYELNRIDRMTVGAIMREIAKCDVVCANCHRERTHQRKRKARKEG